jgi:hypothetical protein
MRVKTDSSRAFEYEFNIYLRDYDDLKKAFLTVYNPVVHSISVEGFFYMNEDDFFTKKLSINKRSGDLDNWSKMPLDIIFKWLGIDDSQVCKIEKYKIPTNDSGTMVFRISLDSYPSTFQVPLTSD